MLTHFDTTLAIDDAMAKAHPAFRHDSSSWQNLIVQIMPRPIVNVGCKNDSPNLEQFGVTQVDKFRSLPEFGDVCDNFKDFVQANARDLPFEDGQYKTAFLGEFLEHCTYEAALEIMQELCRVVADDGRIVVTFPLDNRPKEAQHQPHQLVQWDEGITSWHQTVWEDWLLNKLFKACNLHVLYREELNPGFCPKGWGMVLTKYSSKLSTK